MSNWIIANWLALYGAIVGSIALILGYFRFIYTVGKDKVKLNVTVQPHPNTAENLIELAKPEVREPGGGQRSSLPIYQIKIRNIGNVDAHIESAYVLTDDKNKEHVLVRCSNENLMYGKIEQAGTVLIGPKTSTQMNVYLRRGSAEFIARTAVLVDGTGKKWKAKRCSGFNQSD